MDTNIAWQNWWRLKSSKIKHSMQWLSDTCKHIACLFHDKAILNQTRVASTLSDHLPGCMNWTKIDDTILQAYNAVTFDLLCCQPHRKQEMLCFRLQAEGVSVRQSNCLQLVNISYKYYTCNPLILFTNFKGDFLKRWILCSWERISLEVFEQWL